MLAPTDRRWLRAPTAPPPDPAIEFAVLSWNLLARDWATPTTFAADAADLVWEGEEGRAARLSRELTAITAAAGGLPIVLSAQEVDAATFTPGDTLGQALLAAGFDGGVHYHDVEDGEAPASGGGGTAAAPSSTAAQRPAPALFWPTAAFESVAPPFRLRLGRTPWAVALPRDASTRALSRTKDGAVGVALRHRATGTTHVFASAHLFWNPVFADVKALQAASLAAGLEAAAQAAGTSSILVGGDCNALHLETEGNSPPGFPCAAGQPSDVYTLLSTGVLPPSHPHHPHRWRGGLPAPLDTAGLAFVSARAALGGEPPATTKTRQFEGTLDYIWVTTAAGGLGGTGVERGAGALLRPVAHLQDPAPSVADYDELPNAVYRSDHVAVGAVFRVGK